MKHHTEDYKETAVKYYLNNNDNLRNTCKIFDCKKTTLNRWVNHYKKHKSLNRKTRKNHNLKITPQMENLVKETLRQYPTTTLWEFSKLIMEKYNVRLSDRSIVNILQRNNITRKRLRNKYYPEKYKGQEKEDLEAFYRKLQKFSWKNTICLDEFEYVF